MTTAVDDRVKVLIADDQTLFRAGLARILARDPRLEVVAQAKNGAEAVEETLARHPDVVLMDLQMPVLDGVAATKRLAAEAPSVRVLVLSAYRDRSLVTAAIDNGAKGFVDKDVTPDEIVDRILALAAANGHAPKAPAGELSKRELHILKQVAGGLSNKQIARLLGISEKTVRNHLSRAFSKLRATNRTEAVLSAMRIGLLVF
ncbi:MAG TPA: response regulator transcription factor [Candidatus Dormibacteraeota bacterium]|nr:response regulator transcription factor [Candidatus Dormibacteraeota bacterium]